MKRKNENAPSIAQDRTLNLQGQVLLNTPTIPATPMHAKMIP
jgi:hypothetical protein